MPNDNESEHRLTSDPVEPDGGTGRRGPAERMALCLSGGGYRAMLFHLGVLWRLNDAGYLGKLDRVSSVSGGSITAGVLGMNWDKLAVGDDGVAGGFDELVTRPVRGLASRGIDVKAIVTGGLLPGTSVGDRIARAYRKRLFGSKTLQDLPDRPRFVINATNVQSGALWRFSKPYLWDYRVGKIERPETELACAVAASSAFPPFLSPVTLRFADRDFVPGTGVDLQYPPFTTKALLTDGGVYDNLGLETAYKRYRTVLVSDAGGKMAAEEGPKRNWAQHLYRVLGVIDNQVRSLRKRQLIDAFNDDSDPHNGAYWSTRTNLGDYGLPDALPCPYEQTIRLAQVPTRLKKLPADLQERLINWGYAVSDAALRRHVDDRLAAPGGFPYPEAGVGE